MAESKEFSDQTFTGFVDAKKQTRINHHIQAFLLHFLRFFYSERDASIYVEYTNHSVQFSCSFPSHSLSEHDASGSLEGAMRKMIVIVSIASVLISIALSSTSWAIDVMVKGVDDGVKTNKQQDYREAVMNAKLQAIERAGVEMSSLTRVVNFQTKYDMVESKAEAVLEPGFQIIDIGYSEDGSYLVVLSARVRAVKDMLKEKREGELARQNVERTKNLNAEIGQQEVQVTELKKSIADKEEESWREEQAMVDYWMHEVEKCKNSFLN